MKKFLQNLTRRRIILGLSGLLSFLVFLILLAISNGMAGKQDSQEMAERWSSEGSVAQVSCFFSQNARVNENTLIGFAHGIDSALVSASIVNDSENPSARLWADSFSATGTISLTSTRSTVNVSAVGVSGDFFLFHPLKLVSGSYFSSEDVMKDYCIIDQEIAWQLFGSNDVAGQMITIGGVPHIIKGVIEREGGRLVEAAGLDSSVAYVSYETLYNYGQANEIGCYEIVMPNPVDNYALNYVKENIGVQESELEVVENTSRYSLLSLLDVILGFGTRSMNGKSIIYPYWENVARGYEDILAALLLTQGLFLLYPIVLIVIAIVIAWKHRTWTVSSVYHILLDKWERFLEKVRAKRQQNPKGKGRKRKKEEEW